MSHKVHTVTGHDYILQFYIYGSDLIIAYEGNKEIYSQQVASVRYSKEYKRWHVELCRERATTVMIRSVIRYVDLLNEGKKSVQQVQQELPLEA